MFQLHGHLTRMIMDQPDQWQVAKISRFERISRAEVNTQRELEDIMASLDTQPADVCDVKEKADISKRRKRKFMDIAVPHGIVTGLCAVVCVIFLFNAGKSIEYGGQINDYIERHKELNHVVSVILEEYTAVTQSMTGDKGSKHLSYTFDFTDREIDKFLPDKTMVKWTILNMLRDYRSSHTESAPFHVQLVKYAKFYSQVVTNLKNIAQDTELEFEVRDKWKLAYDLQLKSRQYINTRLLVITLKALVTCISKSGVQGQKGGNCIDPEREGIRSFTSIEGFITEMCSLLDVLLERNKYLSKSFWILRVLHQHIINITHSPEDSFSSLYDGIALVNNSVPMQSQSVNNTSEHNITTLNSTYSEQDYNTESDFTTHASTENNNTDHNTSEQVTIITTMKNNLNDIEHGSQNGNDSISGQTRSSETGIQSASTVGDTPSMPSTQSTVTEHTTKNAYTLNALIDLYGNLENELLGSIHSNIESQNENNKVTMKWSILWFSAVLLALLMVVLLTFLIVTTLKLQSQVVVCVGDWFKHVTDDLNNQRDSLNDIARKVIPLKLTPDVDLHLTRSLMLPYYSKEATFLKFSVCQFTSYFSLFTISQTVHILTLVMELVDERIKQYDAISVTTMGHQQIVFSDTSYNQRATHASEISNLALDIISCCSDLEIGRKSPYSKLHVSIGIHTGPCVGMLYIRNSVINFVVTGNTLDVLHKVHKTAVPNIVQITEPTYKLLEPLDTYSMYVRGNINVKDHYVHKVYWLNGRRISTGTSDCESMCSRIGSWFEIERKPLYRLDEVEGVYEPIDKKTGKLYKAANMDAYM